ncbi:acyl-CoA dehydrogenase family protein [Intestinimonas butyriciproducens]|jgi:alkylation response protein AidB-like acyl-CoA dehydrogenase|uniref:acyl-CoA dehydrogenase family protein n=1 Tax=Intestinimonas butyriciproducens TaxID=1297617 RepID=UPI00242EDAFB
MSSTNLLLSDEQRDLAQTAAQIVRTELAPRVAELDRSGEFPHDVMDTLREAGFYGMGIPEEYGGLGLDAVTQMAIYEEIAKVDAGFSFNFALASGEFSIFEEPDVSEDMRRYYAEKILGGSICSFCLTEAQAGSDASNIRTTAQRVGDEYVLNGTKCFITNGALADLFIVFAYTDKSKGPKGISAFLVEKEQGVQVGKTEDKMGLKLSVTSEIILEDVHIPADRLIGREGRGFLYAMRALEKARVTSMVHALGIAQSAMDIALEYAKVRTTFGKPIIQHQGLGFLLADMQKRVDAARAMLYYSATALDRGFPLGTLSPSTKIFVSETAMSVTTDAVQVLGGYGYMREYPLEKLMRDAKVFSIFEGTNQINLMVSAGMLERKK